MRKAYVATALLSILLLVPSLGAAQQDSILRALREAVGVAEGGDQQSGLFDGSAVVTVDDSEYKIRIQCDTFARPELGFATEPNRVTREATGGQGNTVGLRLRPWKETGDVMVTLERYVAWIPQPTSTGGVLSLTIDMSPASVMRDNMPVLLTYDMWKSGDRPPGRDGVQFEANCTLRDPEAPSYRKVN